MSINKLLWSLAAVALASNSHADFLGVEVILGSCQHPDGLHETWQVVAVFDDGNDILVEVTGKPLCFCTDGSNLYNQALFDGLPLNDFPSVGLGGECYDSYVTIGVTTFPSETEFTDCFLGAWGGNPPPVQVILGNAFSDEGGWFYFNGPPPPVSAFPDMVPGNNTFEIIVAQFTLDNGANFHLGGNIIWTPSSGGPNETSPFALECPGDLDASCVVNTQDLLILLSCFGACPSPNTYCPCDLNNDTVVNIDDLNMLLGNWGPCCPP